MIPNKIHMNLKYLKLTSGFLSPTSHASNGKWEHIFISSIVTLPVSAHIWTVENPGKSQTKEAVWEEHFPALTCSQMLKKLICISILSGLYVEVTPNGHWLDELERECVCVSQTLSLTMNRVCGQKTGVKVKAYVTAAGSSLPSPFPPSCTTKPSHTPEEEVVPISPWNMRGTGIANVI